MFESFDPGRVAFRRVTLRGGTPTFVESLLIVSILRSLVETIGAETPRAAARLMRGGALVWSAFTPTAAPPRVVPSALLLDLVARDPSGLAARLSALLAEDVGRTWLVSEAARARATSTRTLQRRLGEARVNYPSLVRRVRVGAAVDRMASREAPLTAIAYECGFADSAHLSREVRRVVGAPPRDLKAMLDP